MLDSARLRLEPIAREHAALLYDGLQDPALYAYLAADPPTDVGELAARYDFLAGRTSPDGTEVWLNWVLFERAGSAALGYVQATVRGDAAFLGYVLLTGAQRRGYMREAVAAVLDELRRRGVSAVFASVDTRNAGSIAVLEALAFERLGTERSDENVRAGRGRDHRYRLRLGPPPGQAPTMPAG